ncbi:MAG: hypothetical protein HOC20_11720 [Chloroflexi bacterium]|jgi:hypothetical protein|nr:hypothetical protein [Chloroflexota bacterium]
MNVWAIAFDATLEVRIEAETEKEAREIAEKMAEEVRNRDLNLGPQMDLSINGIMHP